MSRLVRLDPASYRRTPWKNGGGVTVDIAAAYAPGAPAGGWDGIVWRLGRTQIAAPGPFSDLPGLDRILTVTGGRGLLLDVAGAPSIDVREPLRPVRFAGEWAITSRLTAGPVEVLNLIADRRRAAIDVAIVRAPTAIDLPAGIHVLYAIAASAVALAGEPIALAADHAVKLDADAQARIDIEGCVALASVMLTVSSRSAP
jgi:uncharacterized protein